MVSSPSKRMPQYWGAFDLAIKAAFSLIKSNQDTMILCLKVNTAYRDKFTVFKPLQIKDLPVILSTGNELQYIL